jgi:gliding motility-associated-like protein
MRLYKPSLLFLLILFCALQSFAQIPPTIIWQKSLGGSSSDYANKIKPTSDGGYIIAGQSFSNDGDVSGHHPDPMGSYTWDCWITKINSSGVIQWQHSYGGDNDDIATCIQQTSDGGYIFAGSTRSNNGDVSGLHFTDDFWVVKINAAGAIQWQKCLGGSSYEVANAIKQTTDGGYIVTGYTNSSDGNVIGSHGYEECWVVKLDNTGTVQWQKCYGGGSGDGGNDIQQTTDGGYIIAGYSGSSDGDLSGVGNHGGVDYFVLKINATGAVQWKKCYGGSSLDKARSIRQTNDGGYVVAGFSNSTDGDRTSSMGSSDYWIVKISNTGAIEWQRNVGGTMVDDAYEIEQTLDGGYIVNGFTQSTDGDAVTNHGHNDYFLVKLSSTGVVQWKKCYGSNYGDDVGFSVLQNADGTFILAGISSSDGGDVTGNHSYGDMWIVKLNAEPVAPCTATIGITSSASSVCAGGTVVFTSTITNGGLQPVYQWKKNGVNVGTNLSTYTDAGLVQGDIVSCLLTSNALCSITPTVTSNNISVTVMPSVLPTVTIAANNTVICSQASVLFTVSALSNEGANPQFQWKVNGINAGSNTNTFNTTTLNNNDVVTVTMTSNSTACLSAATVTSNAITVTVNPLFTTSVVIAASSTQICNGIPITFTATSVNGGVGPVYQWKVNNQNAGTNNAVFVSSSLQNGDVVSCMMTSNATACLSTASAVSNNITVTQKPTPLVSVLANTNTICTGTAVQFTATAVDAGTTVNYEWYINNILTSNSTNPVYTNNSLLNNDLVSCKMITNNGCNYTIASNIISMSVDNPAVVSFLPDTVIDKGSGVRLEPLISGFAVDTYQWTPTIDLDFSNIMNPISTLSSLSRTYKLTVTTKNGCSSDAQVTVKIIDLKIPNVFSPNGDGVHENWNIIGLTANSSVEVFDRNGVIVFHSIGYNSPWEGTYMNKPVPAGSYYYLIDLKDSHKKYSGWLVILR